MLNFLLDFINYEILYSSFDCLKEHADKGKESNLLSSWSITEEVDAIKYVCPQLLITIAKIMIDHGKHIAEANPYIVNNLLTACLAYGLCLSDKLNHGTYRFFKMSLILGYFATELNVEEPAMFRDNVLLAEMGQRGKDDKNGKNWSESRKLINELYMRMMMIQGGGGYSFTPTELNMKMSEMKDLVFADEEYLIYHKCLGVFKDQVQEKLTKKISVNKSFNIDGMLQPSEGTKLTVEIKCKDENIENSQSTMLLCSDPNYKNLYASINPTKAGEKKVQTPFSEIYFKYPNMQALLCGFG